MDPDSDSEQQWEEILHTAAGMIIPGMSGLREPGGPCCTSALSGHGYVQELLNGHARQCKEVARMNHDTFHSICGDLCEGFLEDTLGVTVEEAFIFFLFIVAGALAN
jgi:hypothetical protein